MAQYEGLIPQNVAFPRTRRIGIYSSSGNRVGFIPLGSLANPAPVEKQYSFGALADVHIVYDTAAEDFQRALTYLNQAEDVAFTCICGDLTDDGTPEQLALYKAAVDAHSPDTPVYAIAGNHEQYAPVSSAYLQDYTGKPLYYAFHHGNDVFIMCGCYSWAQDGIFTESCLQWLYEILEENRNRRCFLFEHVMPWNDSGNPGGYYAADLFSGTKGSVFQALLRHYKNTVLFHGHSHTKFALQEADERANYSEAQGYRSVHIPSISVPRQISGSTLANVYADSEGYVVDVYANGIHLRGRDFGRESFLPIASYWIDTTLQPVEAGTFTDSSGIIRTDG